MPIQQYYPKIFIKSQRQDHGSDVLTPYLRFLDHHSSTPGLLSGWNPPSVGSSWKIVQIDHIFLSHKSPPRMVNHKILFAHIIRLSHEYNFIFFLLTGKTIKHWFLGRKCLTVIHVLLEHYYSVDFLWFDRKISCFILPIKTADKMMIAEKELVKWQKFKLHFVIWQKNCSRRILFADWDLAQIFKSIWKPNTWKDPIGKQILQSSINLNNPV